MNSRSARILLVLVAIAIGCASAYYLNDIDRTIRADGVAVNALRDDARALAGTIADVRAGQVAYVAPGQGQDFWMSRVSKLLPELARRAAAFKNALTTPSAQAAFDPGSAAIENFEKLDNRAQDFVKGGNPLLAADLIFADGLEATSTAGTQLEAALNEELYARQSAMAGLRKSQLAVLGGGAGGVLLMLLVLGFAGGARRVAEEPAVEKPAIEPPSPSIDARLTPPPAPEPKRRAPPSLAQAAHLCTDLARVLEPEQLPGLLERAAKVINASGIIVWIAEPPGGELRAAMSFGYSDQVMARMGRISRDASNAAAAAYRSAEMRTVNGAVVAPLLTADGCIGVLSAEMKNGAERDETSQALAAIVAAQLATLVSAPAATAPAQAAQA